MHALIRKIDGMSGEIKELEAYHSKQVPKKTITFIVEGQLLLYVFIANRNSDASPNVHPLKWYQRKKDTNYKYPPEHKKPNVYGTLAKYVAKDPHLLYKHLF